MGEPGALVHPRALSGLGAIAGSPLQNLTFKSLSPPDCVMWMVVGLLFRTPHDVTIPLVAFLDTDLSLGPRSIFAMNRNVF